MNGTIALALGALVFLVLGSAANVVIARLPRQLSEPNRFGELWDTNPWTDVVAGRSRCDSCGAEVAARDNIPVVSFIVLRGRCRSCGAEIPRHHLAVELGSVALFLWAVVVVGWSWVLLPLLIVILPGLVIAAIDFATLMVPTRIVWPTFILVVVSCTAAAGGLGEWRRMLAAAVGLVVLAGPLFAIWFLYPKGMGFGDVRLAVMLGPLVGFAAGTGLVDAAMLALVAMCLSAVVGLIIGVTVLGARGRKAKVPFGPSMILGCWLCALYASDILAPITG